ncbi:unnamed protein product [Miscanthus lutarioriparius]|uniref:Uncharacterized protein n=1 Tax=Miscanthus lutarioriparius TaxID=422564 RepID=A0A811NM31_9POAL|nr:unnamed protein product [Miscanthus lutarioriparius]
MRDTLVGGDHHVMCVEELDNRFDGQIKATRWQSEEHQGLGRPELLPLGHRGARSLETGAKYGMATMPSSSPAVGGGDEEDVGAVFDDEGKGGL